MTVYIVLFCLILIPGLFFNVNKSSRSKLIYLTTVFGYMAIVGSLRHVTVGMDTIQFARAYTYISSSSWGQIFNLRFEPGFIILCRLLSYISSSYRMLFIFTSFFISFSFARFIYKNSENVIISSLVFVAISYGSSLGLLRQFLAVSVLLFGIEFLKKGQALKFAISVIIATSFHFSAIISIVCLFLYKVEIKKGLLVLYLSGTAFMFIFFRYALDIILRIDVLSVYRVYVGSHFDIFDPTRYLKILMILFILIFYKMFVKENNKPDKIKEFFIANMLMAWGAIELFAINMGIISRLIPYFDFISIPAVSNAYSKIKDFGIKTIVSLSIYVSFIAYFYVTRILFDELDLTPFLFFWQHPEDATYFIFPQQ